MAGGLASGALALVAKKDMEKATTGAQYDAAKRRGDRAATVANALVATGAAAAAAGAVLWWLGSKEQKEGPGPTVRIGVGPPEAMMVVAGRF